MAKNKRYFRKSLSTRKYSRRWRNFSKYNYNNIKVDCNFHIQYPGTNGDPVIYFGTSVAAKAYTLSSLLYDHSDFPTFKPLYSMFKIRGFRFEVTPMSCNAGNENITQSSGVFLGYSMTTVGNNELENTSWMPTSDRAIVLNPLAKTYKYFSLFGGQDDWKLMTTNISGLVGVYSDEKSTLNSGPVWHCKMTVYICCKFANK